MAGYSPIEQHLGAAGFGKLFQNRIHIGISLHRPYENMRKPLLLEHIIHSRIGRIGKMSAAVAHQHKGGIRCCRFLAQFRRQNPDHPEIILRSGKQGCAAVFGNVALLREVNLKQPAVLKLFYLLISRGMLDGILPLPRSVAELTVYIEQAAPKQV
jgi:hypothetical protein